MKNLKYLIVIFALIFVVGCDDGSDALPPAFQDATWVTNIRPSEDYIVKIGESITFRDLSQGALSHEFILEEGNRYLSRGFRSNDSLPLFINKNLGLVSTEKDAHVLFLNQGINKVKIRNTFADSLGYKGKEPIPAFKENGVWVIENSWDVDVYGVLKPAFKVLDKDGVELINISGDDKISINDVDSWPTISIEAGEELTYVDLTTEDRPNGRTWALQKAKPKTSNDSIATVGYFSLGKFNAGTFTSSREDDLPNEKVKKIIPLIVEVIPSTKPFIHNVAGGMTESPNEIITFGVTGELAKFTGDEKTNFTVNVKNVAAGYDQDIPVALATINANDRTKINLKMSAPIFNSDIITVSYSGGVIKSVDARTLDDFGPVMVDMYPGLNLLTPAFSGFESGSSNFKKAFCNGFWVGNPNGSADAPFYSRVIDKFVTEPASMLFNAPDGIPGKKTLQGNDFKKTTFTGTSYILSIKIYLGASNTMSNITTVVTNPSTAVDWDIENLPREEWITLTQAVTFSASPSKRYDVVVDPGKNPNATSGSQKFYIDDMFFTAIEER